VWGFWAICALNSSQAWADKKHTRIKPVPKQAVEEQVETTRIIPHPERMGGMCEVPVDPIAAAPILKLNQEIKAITLKESRREREAAFENLRDQFFDKKIQDVWIRTGHNKFKDHPELN
jgi:hypothetical protein